MLSLPFTGMIFHALVILPFLLFDLCYNNSVFVIICFLCTFLQEERGAY